MAIVQVSRITVRKGLAQDLPQPLAGGEIGYAQDERRLFIGNGTLSEGAPVVGNTEILTEFSDILGFATAYTYQGEAGGYIVQTGVTPSNPVTQSLQSRLDSYAIVTDFGAVGDGITDNTDAINRALYQLYCVDNNAVVRRSLFFPAGNYVVSGTINIPSYAKLYGEGADCTFINFNILPWASLTAYPAGVLVEYSGSYYRSIIDVPPTETTTPNLDATYWVNETLDDYIARTADSKQQTGAQITANGAEIPRNIELSGITFQTNVVINGFLVQDAAQCYFDSVNFIGPEDESSILIGGSANDIAAISFSSTTSSVCEQINFDKCRVNGWIWGINTDQQVKGVTFSNGWFDTMYSGVLLGSGTPVNGGPTGFRILHNIFDNIYANGVYIGNISLNVSAYNIFYDVGNEFGGEGYAAYSVIYIGGPNNVSIGDMFERSTLNSATYPRIDLDGTASLGLTNAVQLQLGAYVREVGLTSTINDNASNVSLFTVDATKTRAFQMEYTLTRGTATETGTYVVVASTDGTGGNLATTQDDVYNTSTGITFSATETGSVVTVKYSSTSTGTAGNIYYSVTHLA